VWFNFQSGAFFGYGFTPTILHLANAFQPLGINIPAGNYNYTRQEMTFSTDPSKILNLVFDYKWGNYFNGKLNSGDVKLQFAPIPHISFLGEFNRNQFTGVGDPVTSKTVDLYILQGRLALNPRVQLSGLYQKNSLNNAQNYNIRLSWEFEPLSYLYIIYNHGSYTNSLMLQNPSEDHLLAKISYLKQF
jgi:hypothetical protein